MSGPAYVVLPVSNGGYQGQDTSEIVAAIQEALHRKTHPEEYIEPEHTGPLKQIIANQDSLYKYISWEDPVRTLGAYVGALSVLFGAHYIPLTQVILKAGLSVFGVVSVSEFASRSLGKTSISARLRPEEYKQVPEPILNDTLKDIHDLIQWGVVQAQRILYGQDLEKTFAAFLSFTALYWLIQIVSPFWLAVAALTSVFLAPLIASPRGRAAARDATVRAQELANQAVENGKDLAHTGKDKATELSSKAQQAAVDTKGHVQDLAQSGKQAAANGYAQVRETASNISGAATENARGLAQQGKAKASDLSSQAQQTAVNTKESVQDIAQSGKQSVVNGSTRASNTASDMSNSARDTASNMTNSARGTASDWSNSAKDTASNVSSSATENAKDLSQKGSNTIDKAQDNASSALGDAKKYVNSPLSSEISGNSSKDHSVAGQAANKAYQVSNNIGDTAKHMAPQGLYDQSKTGDYNYGSSTNGSNGTTRQAPYDNAAKRPTSAYMEPTPLSAELIGNKTSGSADTTSIYADTQDVSGSHGIINRPRGL